MLLIFKVHVHYRLLNLDNSDFHRHLNVLSGVYSWNLMIDVQVLCYGGNAIDACALAINSAVASTELPSIITFGSSVSLSDAKASNFERDLFDLALDDASGQQKTELLPFRDLLPLTVTFANVFRSIFVDFPPDFRQRCHC